jgi:hypothetical protein
VAKLEALMRQWREMFRANVGIARRILRELLAGERVVFTPGGLRVFWREQVERLKRKLERERRTGAAS